MSTLSFAFLTQGTWTALRFDCLLNSSIVVKILLCVVNCSSGTRMIPQLCQSVAISMSFPTPLSPIVSSLVPQDQQRLVRQTCFRVLSKSFNFSSSSYHRCPFPSGIPQGHRPSRCHCSSNMCSLPEYPVSSRCVVCRRYSDSEDFENKFRRRRPETHRTPANARKTPPSGSNRVAGSRSAQ